MSKEFWSLLGGLVSGAARGRGEMRSRSVRGAGGYLPTSGAAGAIVGHYLERARAAVLLPQCRAGSYWSDPLMDEMVMTALSQTESEFKADPARVYLTGVSMGGYG